MSNLEKNKLVFSGKMARYLLKLGYQIVDVKADKYIQNKTVFIFKNEGNLIEDMKEIK